MMLEILKRSAEAGWLVQLVTTEKGCHVLDWEGRLQASHASTF